MLSEFNSDEKNQREERLWGDLLVCLCIVWRGKAEGYMCVYLPHVESFFLAIYLTVALQIQ